MSKKIFMWMLSIGFVITSLTFFTRIANPICNYSNSMSQEEMMANPGYQRGYPFHYLSDDAWQCNAAGETGKSSKDFQLFTNAFNFLGDWFVWFAVSFTMYSLSKSVRKKR